MAVAVLNSSGHDTYRSSCAASSWSGPSYLGLCRVLSPLGALPGLHGLSLGFRQAETLHATVFTPDLGVPNDFLALPLPTQRKSAVLRCMSMGACLSSLVEEMRRKMLLQNCLSDEWANTQAAE